MAANVNIVINAKDRASGTIKGIAGALGNILQVATGISLARLFDKALTSMRQFVVNSIDATAFIQQMQVGVETLIARELKLADSQLSMNDALAQAQPLAEKMMDELANLAIISPYQLEQVNTTFRQAMAFGFATKEALLFTEALLNVAAGTGANNERMERMAYNLSQVRLQGKVTKLDIRQLALAGFDLVGFLQDLGRQFGITIEDHEDFNKAIAAGKITWEEFAVGFARYADEYFGGASERMARTLFGLKNTFKDVFMLTMPAILGPTVDKVVDFINILLDKFIELRDSGILEEWGKKLAEAYEEHIAPILDAIGKLVTGEYNFSDLIEEIFGDKVRSILTNFFGEDYPHTLGQFVDAWWNLQRFFEKYGEPIGASLKELWEVLMPGVDIASIVDTIGASLLDFSENLLLAGPDINNNIRLISDAIEEDIKPALKTLGEYIGTYGPPILTFFGTFLTFMKIAGVMAGIAAAAGPLAASLGEVAAFAGLAIEVISGGGGLFGILLGLAGLVVVAIGPIAALGIAIAGLVTAIVFLGPQAWTSLTQLGQIIWYGLGEIGRKIAEWWEGVKTTWAQNWENFKIIAADWVQRTVYAMLGEVDLKAFIEKGLDAGGKFISGLADGITSGWSKITKAATDAAQKAWEAAKDFLGMKSPSTKGMEIGENFVLAIAKGMEKMTLQPQIMATKTAGRMTQAMDRTGGEAKPSKLLETVSRSVNFNAPLHFSRPITPEEFSALLKDALYG